MQTKMMDGLVGPVEDFDLEKLILNTTNPEVKKVEVFEKDSIADIEARKAWRAMTRKQRRDLKKRLRTRK